LCRPIFKDVLDELKAADLLLDAAWFAPHFEFRFPVVGTFTQAQHSCRAATRDRALVRAGEEPAGGATVRYVDSSVERVQVKVQGLTDRGTSSP